MDELNNTASQQSVTERLLSRLAVHAPAKDGLSMRIDVIYNPELDLLRGPPE